MKKFHMLKFALILFAGILLINSCVPEGEDQVGSAGTTIVKFLPSEFALALAKPISESQTIFLFDVRRDIKDNGDLNSSTTVTLQFDVDTTMLNEYNAKNEAEFVMFPYDLYTMSPAPDANGLITLNFAAGEYSKSFFATIPDALSFDFTKKYAIAFKMTSISGTGVITQNSTDTLVCQVLCANQYDGKYEVTPITPMLDVVSATLTGWYPLTFFLETTGEHGVDVFCGETGNYTHGIMSGTAYSQYGFFGIHIEFNPDGSGEILSLSNVWGPLAGANQRDIASDPDATENGWDPATKNIKLKYIMTQAANAGLSPPYYRTYFDELWTYKGSR